MAHSNSIQRPFVDLNVVVRVRLVACIEGLTVRHLDLTYDVLQNDCHYWIWNVAGSILERFSKALGFLKKGNER